MRKRRNIEQKSKSLINERASGAGWMVLASNLQQQQQQPEQRATNVG